MSILVDTSVFYAFYNKRDVHHIDSICLLTHILEGRYGRPYTVCLVVSETYTLLRYRIGYATAIAFLEALEKSGIKILFLDEEGYSRVLEILEKYSDRKLSFTDASLVYILENYGIENMASYDERSFSGLVARILGKNYANTLSKEEVDRIISLTKKTSHIKF
ncbi:MAG: PIN domain-containing protein [Thermoproteales archaeon]|nr:PIN domain-containing protein [Thermoproteales archaeon]